MIASEQTEEKEQKRRMRFEVKMTGKTLYLRTSNTETEKGI
jgi:hypothetical protein